MTYPKVSVIIPVKNEALKIRACIEGILNQTVPVYEIIVIDSGSIDGTKDILREYQKVKLIEIRVETFNHGETRNLGVSHATGEFVVLTVGDARPYNEHWIAELLEGFTDNSVVGVCGQQVVPHEKDKNPAEWYRPITDGSVKKISFPQKEAFNLLTPEQKRHACGWDNVTAMYKRDILRKIPFRQTSFAEDAQWAKDVLQQGFTIVYNTYAKVYHYHLEDPAFTYARTFTVSFHMYKFFGYLPSKPSKSVYNSLQLIKILLKESSLGFAEKIRWYRYNLQCRKNSSC
jgi:rhamnosyltransferase